MRCPKSLILAAVSAALVASPATARPRDDDGDRRREHALRDQDRVFQSTRRGESMPLPLIERRVVPHMGGADYLGPEFRGRTYRLKFMRDGRVIWIDVDAATGRILGRSGD